MALPLDRVAPNPLWPGANLNCRAAAPRSVRGPEPVEWARRQAISRSQNGSATSAGPAFEEGTAGFTLVELLVGSSLAAMIMAAVLSSYIFLGRNLTRLGNQQALETQGRRALAYFAQDVRMARGISGTPAAASVSLTLPYRTGTTTVTYTYNSTDKTLVRTPAIGTAQTLLFNLQSFSLSYYDASSAAITDFTNGLASIKQISLTFSSQTGVSSNGTQTRVYQAASPRLIVRNKPLLL